MIYDIYVHAYEHTYIHTYMHACMHACIRTVLSCTPISICISMSLSTSLYLYIPVSLYLYLYLYTHMYVSVCGRLALSRNMYEFKHAHIFFTRLYIHINNYLCIWHAQTGSEESVRKREIEMAPGFTLHLW